MLLGVCQALAASLAFLLRGSPLTVHLLGAHGASGFVKRVLPHMSMHISSPSVSRDYPHERGRARSTPRRMWSRMAGSGHSPLPLPLLQVLLGAPADTPEGGHAGQLTEQAGADPRRATAVQVEFSASTLAAPFVPEPVSLMYVCMYVCIYIYIYVYTLMYSYTYNSYYYCYHHYCYHHYCYSSSSSSYYYYWLFIIISAKGLRPCLKRPCVSPRCRQAAGASPSTNTAWLGRDMERRGPPGTHTCKVVGHGTANPFVPALSAPKRGGRISIRSPDSPRVPSPSPTRLSLRDASRPELRIARGKPGDAPEARDPHAGGSRL